MNTKIFLIKCVLIFLFSCQQDKMQENLNSKTNYTNENLDGTITIQGIVTLKGSNKPPLGVTTMNVKNKWNYTKDFTSATSKRKKTAFGENKRVFVRQDGYYSITINKYDTLVLIPTPYLYKKPKNFIGLNKSQNLNIELEPLPLNVIQEFQKENSLGYNTFYNQLKTINPDSLITISGSVYNSITKKPLENIPITTSFIINTNGASTFHLTNRYGQFTINTPKKSHIVINGIDRNYIDFIAKNDTVINLNL
ncbi:hypothetical protein [Myroides pelagicus]|uniref:Uncharacterized protein n=1 Tax=Myroides pelagicus TaxID=270914 RepID=A0A7K1GQY1_9FLAO|nr:hypothetical protein [Myroides pelagicus]MTH30889.1 hypothetical protein [Myroides pelagicus]